MGKTQQRVAMDLGVDRSYVAQLERGRSHSIQIHTAALLGEILGTSLDYLLLRVEDDPGEIPPRNPRGEERSLVGGAPHLLTVFAARDGV